MPTASLYANLPGTPGVYLMKDQKGRVLYVGKAGNLRRRVSSYFNRPQDSKIQKLVSKIKKVDFQKTGTAVEALILEAELIKKLSPPFNVLEKDDKSFLYVGITKEKFPRVLLVRGKIIRRARLAAPPIDHFSSSRRSDRENSVQFSAEYGPFTSASDIRAALRIIRRIFPWSVHPSTGIKEEETRSKGQGASDKGQGTRGGESRPCFDYEIGLCPGTCAGLADRKEYLRNIRNIKLFFAGKKDKILRSLKKEMMAAAKKLDFEKAEKLKRQIFALQHIQDVALLGEESFSTAGERKLRIEGYDISNISGTSAVGSMVVFIDGKPAKDEYRKFKIRTISGVNDVAMLGEVIRRRLQNPWPLPDVVLVDGGKTQVSVAKKTLDGAGLRIPVVGIAKGPKRKRTDIVGLIPLDIRKKTLIQVRDEAHRFAIGYHRRLRSVKSLE